MPICQVNHELVIDGGTWNSWKEATVTSGSPTGVLNDLERHGIRGRLDLASLLDVVFARGFGYAIGGSPWRTQSPHEAGVYRHQASMTKRTGSTPADALARALVDVLDTEANRSGDHLEEAVKPTNPQVAQDGRGLHTRAIEAVAKRLLLHAASPSMEGYDLEDDAGTRYLVKARTKGSSRDYELGAIKTLDREQFDYLVFVKFDRHSGVYQMWRLPFDLVREASRFEIHKNGHVPYLRPWVLEDSRAEQLQ